MLIKEKMDKPKYEGDIKEIIETLEVGIFDFFIEEGELMNQEWWQFKDEDEIVGYGWIDKTVNFEISFVVKEEFRKSEQSIGRQIIVELEEIGRIEQKSQIEAIIKTTNPYSEAVISLLISLGYENDMFENKEDIIKHARNFKKREGFTTIMYKKTGIV